MNKKYIFITLIVILLAAAVAYYSLRKEDTDDVVEPQTITIGAILPLTEDYAFLGTPIQNAILMAKEDWENKTKYNYKIIFEDGQLDPETSANAAQKLINVDKVDAIITFNSGVGNITSPIAQENKVIHMGIASDASVAEGNYNFIHWTQPEEEARLFVDELEKRELTKIAVIGVYEGGGEVILNSVKDLIADKQIGIVSEDLFATEETDFRTTLLKAEQQNPDIYLLLVGTNRLDLIAKQAEELGIDKPMTSIENFEFTENPSLFEGMWYIQAAEASVDFNSRYEEKYGEKPAVGAPNAYDEYNLLVTAFETSGESTDTKPDIDSVLKKLTLITNFEGALGPLNVNESGIVESKAAVKIIKDGEFVFVEQ